MPSLTHIEHLRPTEDLAMFNIDIATNMQLFLEIAFNPVVLNEKQLHVIILYLLGYSDGEIARYYDNRRQNITDIRKTAWNNIAARSLGKFPTYEEINWREYRETYKP